VNTKLKGRDFITLMDYSKEDMETILQVALDLKSKVARREPHPLLAGKTLGMLFCSPSLRTRVAFETAMSQLGGHAQYYAPEQLHLVKDGKIRESWEHNAQVLSRYVDGLMVRLWTIAGFRPLRYGEARAIMNTIAANASIPVISGLDDMEHPTQVMADIMTLIEKFGPDYKKRKVALVWVRKASSIPPGIPHSLAIAGGSLGMRLTFAYPEGFDLDPEYMKTARRLAEQSGGSIEMVHNISEAVKDADVIYAKNWGAIRKTPEEDLRMRTSFEDWYVREEHFDHAAPSAIFMHAMPVDMDQEVTSEVANGPRSVIYDQAENRLHVVKAIMSLIMG